MSPDRLRSEVSPVVTSAVGIVVALVSGVFGVSAHGLAAGAAAAPPTPGQILTVVAASVGVGAIAAARARQCSPVLTAGAGLIVGQGLVHMVLASGHSHPGHAAGTLGHHAVDPAAVRAAMDGQGLESAHAADLLTPGMFGAHMAAIALTLTLVAVLTGTLSWLAARVMPMLATAHLVVVAPLVTSYDADAPRGQFFISRGGTRAPPLSV